MIHREPLEWTRTWWEQAESGDLPRILLIGDSIVCGYRDGVQEELRGKAYVDQFATSKFAADPFFAKELNLYLEAYPYDCIHFNHGLHGRDFPLDVYEHAYEETLKKLLTVCPHVILTLSTPITRSGNPAELDSLNQVVTERNQVVLDLAEKYQLPVDDLYALVLGHPEYRVMDGYHYNESGKAVQSKQVAETIMKIIE
ncbi:MAG: SGNH/GDSL hydrolase family protein [Candidatus Merdivicinus sp.]|jgi:lysophospholipase L1-like esterase